MLQLIEDPDEEVFATVSEQIISIGMPIIPSLEHMWESETDQYTQIRIERLIHDLHFSALKKELTDWALDSQELITGALLAAKYLYPEITIEQVNKEIEKIRRSIWLELNNYLTPIEKITVVNSILFNYFKISHCESDFSATSNFALNSILTTKKGNRHGLRMLYLILCQQLDINVKAVDIPQQILLAYYVMNSQNERDAQLLFYIDPANGQLYSVKDVENYMKKTDDLTKNEHRRPLSNQQTISNLLTALSQCYKNEEMTHRRNELLLLAELTAIT